MSLPGLFAYPLLSKTTIPASIATNPFDAVLGTFSSNLYFIGIMMLIMNLGGRFLSMELSKGQEQFFQNPWVRRCLIFVVLFIATRNLWVAFWLTLIVILILGFLLNENSSLSIFGKPTSVPTGTVPSMTVEESEIFRRLYEKKMRTETPPPTNTPTKPTDPFLVYMANMNLISQ